METLYKEVAQLMVTLKQCVVLSGAGIYDFKENY